MIKAPNLLGVEGKEIKFKCVQEANLCLYKVDLLMNHKQPDKFCVVEEKGNEGATHASPAADDRITCFINNQQEDSLTDKASHTYGDGTHIELRKTVCEILRARKLTGHTHCRLGGFG